MRIALALVMLSLPVSGCWTLEPQKVALSDATQARLEAQFGDDLEAMRGQLAAEIGADVKRIVLTETGRLEAVLVPPMQEALSTGAESFVGRIVENPTAQDAVAGLIVAALGAFGVLRYRRGLREAMPRKK